ncbi:MAG: hypothetical protein K6E10_01090 [Eubacterium sp.]|nr:hypothetical protein [Eubacterium sp.]
MLIRSKKETPDFHIEAPPSKSIYHRELIVRFLCGDFQHLDILGTDNDDVIATKSVLMALKSKDQAQEDYLTLPCKESGSTLRFMIPVAAAYILGQDTCNSKSDHRIKRLIFQTEGRLFDRPLKELEAALAPHGISINKDSESRQIIVSGHMTPGQYIIDGSVSSQYISGLMMALTLFDKACSIKVTGKVKSFHYIELTMDALEKYNCPVNVINGHDYIEYIPSLSAYKNASEKGLKEFSVEGDWSNGAYLLCMKEFSNISVGNLNPDSRQGDRAILDYLKLVKKVRKTGPASNSTSNKEGNAFALVNDKNADVLADDRDKNEDISAVDTDKAEYSWDCSDIPDIVPYMAMLAPFIFDKIVFTGIGRLRIKESDRVKAIREQLNEAGVVTEENEDSLTIYRISDKARLEDEKKTLNISSYNDHRMAMTGVLLSVILKTSVEIDNIECMKKSFPEFLDYIDKYFS